MDGGERKVGSLGVGGEATGLLARWLVMNAVLERRVVILYPLYPTYGSRSAFGLIFKRISMYV